MPTHSHPDSFKSKSTLTAGSKTYTLFRLKALEGTGVNLARLPFSLRILLENLLRHEDGRTVTADDIKFLANWDAKAEPSREIAYMPARVLMQDFTGVPAIVDLAAMRDAMRALGGDPEKINPLQPAELVIDHSVQVDQYGTSDSAPGQRSDRAASSLGLEPAHQSAPPQRPYLHREPCRHQIGAPGS